MRHALSEALSLPHLNHQTNSTVTDTSRLEYLGKLRVVAFSLGYSIHATGHALTDHLQPPCCCWGTPHLDSIHMKDCIHRLAAEAAYGNVMVDA